MEVMEMILKLTDPGEIWRVIPAVYGLDPAELEQLRKASAAEAQQKEESAAEVQQSTAKEEPTAEPEKTKPIQHKGLDKGKIIALYRAGWTVAKIADEMKCSKTAVYNITQEQ